MRGQDERSLPLWLLILCTAGLGVWLGLVAGGPSVPSLPADWAAFESTLRSSAPPLDGALVLARDLGWLLFGWLVLSLALQAAAALAEGLGTGNRRVRRFRVMCDWLSLPLVRRTMRTAMAGSVFVQMASSLSFAHAAPIESRPVNVAEFVGGGSVSAQTSESASAKTQYTVRHGDTLAGIAAQFYGDDTAWRPIYDANQGRIMTDGATFSRAGVIRPGWVLAIPDAAADQIDDSGRTVYTVHGGDTLWAISERELGDPQRYQEIFDRNVGTAVDDAHTLRDPNLIWPGLRLVLAEPDSTPSTAAPAVPPPHDASPPPTQSDAPVTAAAPTAQSAPADDAPAAGDAAAPPSAVPQDAAPAATESHAGGLPIVPIGLGLVAAAGIGAGGRAVRNRRRPALAGARPMKGFAPWKPEALPGERRLARVVADVMDNQPGRLVAGYAAAEAGALVFDVASDHAEAMEATAQAMGATSAEAGRGRVKWDLPKWPRRSAMGDEATVLPLGMEAERVLYAPWPKAGSLLLAGEASAGVRTALEALVADMALRVGPDRLGLYFVGDSLSESLCRLPHARGPIISSDDDGALTTLVNGLGSRTDGAGERVDVLVVGEWSEAAPTAARLLTPELEQMGVRVVAALTAIDEHTANLVQAFRNRLVFHVSDEPTSLALLGDPGAELLDRQGQCYPLIDGQPLPPVRAFRIAPEELEALCSKEPAAHSAPVVAEPEVVPMVTTAPPPMPAAPRLPRPAPAPDAADQLPMGGMLTAVPSHRLPVIPSSPPPLAFHLLGNGEILLNGTPLEVTRANGSAWELLLLVCSLPPGEASFARLTEMLSGAEKSGDPVHYVEAAISKARTKLLAQWLTPDQVRRALRVEGKACMIDPTVISTDVHEFVRLASEAERSREPAMAATAARQAADLYRGDLFGDTAPYPWVAGLCDRYSNLAAELAAKRVDRDLVKAVVSRVA